MIQQMISAIQIPFIGVLFFLLASSVMIAAINNTTATTIIPLLRNSVNTESNYPTPLVIDRTSFSNSKTQRKSLDWLQNIKRYAQRIYAFAVFCDTWVRHRELPARLPINRLQSAFQHGKQSRHHRFQVDIFQEHCQSRQPF